MSEPRRGVVWIVGAGFSKFLGAPMLTELLTTDSIADLGTVFKLNGEEHSEAKRVAAVFAAGIGRFWKDAEEFIERLDTGSRNENAAAIMERHIRAVWNIKQWQNAFGPAVR